MWRTLVEVNGFDGPCFRVGAPAVSIGRFLKGARRKTGEPPFCQLPRKEEESTHPFGERGSLARNIGVKVCESILYIYIYFLSPVSFDLDKLICWVPECWSHFCVIHELKQHTHSFLFFLSHFFSHAKG